MCTSGVDRLVEDGRMNSLMHVTLNTLHYPVFPDLTQPFEWPGWRLGAVLDEALVTWSGRMRHVPAVPSG